MWCVPVLPRRRPTADAAVRVCVQSATGGIDAQARVWAARDLATAWELADAAERDPLAAIGVDLTPPRFAGDRVWALRCVLVRLDALTVPLWDACGERATDDIAAAVARYRTPEAVVSLADVIATAVGRARWCTGWCGSRAQVDELRALAARANGRSA